MRVNKEQYADFSLNLVGSHVPIIMKGLDFTSFEDAEAEARRILQQHKGVNQVEMWLTDEEKIFLLATYEARDE